MIQFILPEVIFWQKSWSSGKTNQASGIILANFDIYGLSAFQWGVKQVCSLKTDWGKEGNAAKIGIFRKRAPYLRPHFWQIWWSSFKTFYAWVKILASFDVYELSAFQWGAKQVCSLKIDWGKEGNAAKIGIFRTRAPYLRPHFWQIWWSSFKTFYARVKILASFDVYGLSAFQVCSLKIEARH